MDDAGVVSGFQRSTDLDGNRNRVFPWQSPFFLQQIGKCLALDVLHGVVVKVAFDAAFIQFDHMRVLQLLQRIDFPGEANDESILTRQRGGQHLDGRSLFSLLVMPEIDRPHPASTNLLLNQIRPYLTWRHWSSQFSVSPSAIFSNKGSSIKFPTNPPNMATLTRIPK